MSRRARAAGFLGVYLVTQAGLMTAAAFTIDPSTALDWIVTAFAAGVIALAFLVGVEVAFPDLIKGDDS